MHVDSLSIDRSQQLTDDATGGIAAVESLLSAQAEDRAVAALPPFASIATVAAGTPENSEQLLQASDPVSIITDAIAPDTVTLAGSNIVFHNSYGSGANAAYHQAVIDAEHAIQSHLSAGSTVDLYASFDFASLGPNFSGQNNFLLYTETYASWRAQVVARATSADDAAAAAALPTNDPTGGLGVSLPSGYARMMGLNVGNDVDAIVLNSDLNFNFANGDAAGVLEHELTEGAMGRVGSLGFRTFGNGTHFWNPMDFFRFTAGGTRDYTGGMDGVSTYFGFDSTHVFTGFQYHNSIDAQGHYDGFDLADWDNTFGDAFGPGGPGAPGVMSPTDLRVMDVLGWRPVTGDDFPANTNTTGVVPVDGSATGNLETAGDHDWFRVQLTAGVKYQIDLQGQSVGAGTLQDPLMKLFNGAGQLLAQDDDGGGNFNSRIIYTPSVTGAYYVDAGAYQDQGTGTYRVSLSSEKQFQPMMSVLSAFGPHAGGWSSENVYPRELADVNGDHKADIVGFAAGGVVVSLATSGGGFAAPTSVLGAFGTSAGGWDTESHYPRHLADVDGDGRADIVGFGEGGVSVALANPSGGFGAPFSTLAAFGPSAGGWTNDDIYHRELADVNGDHMADIVGFGEGGVFVSLATGGGAFATPHVVLSGFGRGAGGWTSEDAYPRHVADVNGDGFADIIGFGQSAVFVALGKADGTFKAATTDIAAFGPGAGGWSSDNTYPRFLADINGDHSADIVGFGDASVFASLSNGLLT